MTIELVTNPQGASKETVKLLEDILKKAREGEILSIGICAATASGEVYDGAAGGTNVASLLGASVLLTDRIKRWLE